MDQTRRLRESRMEGKDIMTRDEEMRGGPSSNLRGFRPPPPPPPPRFPLPDDGRPPFRGKPPHHVHRTYLDTWEGLTVVSDDYPDGTEPKGSTGKVSKKERFGDEEIVHMPWPTWPKQGPPVANHIDLEKNLPRATVTATSIEPKKILLKLRPRPLSSNRTATIVRKAITPELDRIIESELGNERVLDHKGFSQRVVEAAEGELFHDLKGGKGRVIGKALNVSTMQRLNIHAIQRDIVRVANEIHKFQLNPQSVSADGRKSHNSSRSSSRSSLESDPDWDGLKKVMNEYCGYPFLIYAIIDLKTLLMYGNLGQVWRDWRTIAEFAVKGPLEDPFILTTINELSMGLMKEEGIPLPDKLFVQPRLLSELLPGYARHHVMGVEKAARVIRLFCWSFGGGLSLIAPMLLMRLHHTLLTQLLTTGLSVMIFAGVIAALEG